MGIMRSMFKNVFGSDTIKQVPTKNIQMFSGGDTFYVNTIDYFDNDIVVSCIRPKATEIGKLTLNLIRTNKDGKTEIDFDPSLRYLLRFPNEIMTMQDLLEKMVWQYETTGNTYAYILRDTYTGQVISINALETSMVRVCESLNGILMMEISFSNGKKAIVPYSDIIHLRKDFIGEFYGQPLKRALNEVLKTVRTIDLGTQKAIASNGIIKWLLTWSGTYKLEDQIAAAEAFRKAFLDPESNVGGVATVDNKATATQIKEDIYMPNEKAFLVYRKRVMDFFGVNEKIVAREYTEDIYNSFYEMEIEPFARKFADQLTLKLLTKNQFNSYGNQIIANATSLQYASMKSKIELYQMVDRGAMTPNEWRKVMNLPTVDGADDLIRRLDTEPVNDTKKKTDPLKVEEKDPIEEDDEEDSEDKGGD